MPNSYVWQAVSKWVTLLSKKGNPHIETIKAKCHYACHSWYLCENLLQHISIYWNIGVSMLIKRKMSVNWLIFASPTLISSLYLFPCISYPRQRWMVNVPCSQLRAECWCLSAVPGWCCLVTPDICHSNPLHNISC